MLRLKQILPFYNTARAWVALGSYKDYFAIGKGLVANSSDSDDTNDEKKLFARGSNVSCKTDNVREGKSVSKDGALCNISKVNKVSDKILDKRHGLPSEKSKNLSHIDATEEACSKHSNFINGFSEIPIASMLTKLKSRATGVLSFSSRIEVEPEVVEPCESTTETLKKLGFAFAGKILYSGGGASFMVQRASHPSLPKEKTTAPAVKVHDTIKTTRKEVNGHVKNEQCPLTQIHEDVAQNTSICHGSPLNGIEPSSYVGLSNCSINADTQVLQQCRQERAYISKKRNEVEVKQGSKVFSNSSLLLDDNCGSKGWQVCSKILKPRPSKGASYHQTPKNTVNCEVRNVNCQVKKVGQQYGYDGDWREPIDCVCNILWQLKWSNQTEFALSELNRKLSPYQVNEILKSQKDASIASSFFAWAKKQKGFRHDVHTYTTMVGILGRAQDFEGILELMEEMKKDGCKPSIVTFNRLIHCYGRANRMDEALQIFHGMKSFGCVPDKVTYCTLIDLHAKSGSLDVAMNMYNQMQEAGLQPDTFTYSVIINCLGKAGDLSSAQKVLNEMIGKGCTPTLVTYNILIDLHAKSGKHKMALKLYDDMLGMGYHPDRVTYSIIMEVLRHSGHLHEVEYVFSQMEEAGWAPDATVYGLLVDMWGKVGNSMKACGWYNKMLNSGVKPNVPTFNSLLGAFLREKTYDAGMQLIADMANQGLAPSLQTYTLLLSCYTMSERKDDSDKIWSMIASVRHPAHAFLCTLHQRVRAREGEVNIRECTLLFFEMISNENQESKRSVVDAIISYLHKAQMRNEAAIVWEIAAEKRVYPTAVTRKAAKYWAINLHCMSMGTAIVALSRTLASLKQRMLDTGVTPDRIDIITGWGRRSRVVGSSLVKQAVEDTLNALSSPFHVENSNMGCFVGIGQALVDWLYESDMDKVHMLT